MQITFIMSRRPIHIKQTPWNVITMETRCWPMQQPVTWQPITYAPVSFFRDGRLLDQVDTQTFTLPYILPHIDSNVSMENISWDKISTKFYRNFVAITAIHRITMWITWIPATHFKSWLTELFLLLKAKCIVHWNIFLFLFLGY